MRESDLSGPLQRWLREVHGLCVHGEVAVFDRSRTLDHVAHTGPCSAPVRVWNLELKVGMTAEFLSQLAGVARGHFASLRPPGPSEEAACTLPPGVWAVTPLPKTPHTLASARARLLATRGSRLHPYLQPGWITVDEHGEVVIQEVPVLVPPYKYSGSHIRRLLLVPQNRGVTGGLPSGAHQPVTHWSVCWEAVRAALASDGAALPWTEESLRVFLSRILEDDPAAAEALLAPYRKPRGLVGRLGKELAKAGFLTRAPKYGSSSWR